MIKSSGRRAATWGNGVARRALHVLCVSEREKEKPRELLNTMKHKGWDE